MGLPGSPDFDVDIHKAKEMIENGEVDVVDVRTQFHAPAMPGADYVPLDDILARPGRCHPNREAAALYLQRRDRPARSRRRWPGR